MNTWRWDSVEEFKNHVQPIESAPENAVRSAPFYSALEHVREFFRVAYELRAGHERLKRILKKTAKEPTSPLSEDQFGEVHMAALTIVLNGEYALAYCKPLSLTKGAREFIIRKEVCEHLSSYHKQGGWKCKHKANWLLEATSPFVMAIHDFLEGENLFLNYVSDLPEDLKIDFVAAHDVMSLGFDEAGLIYAGRGLEGVVRRIAKDHKIIIGGKVPNERENISNILKALEEKRFSHDQSLVIDEQTSKRLQLSKVMRNHSAHPKTQRSSQGHREGAILMAQKANDLWKKCSVPGIKFI